jgi:hypothetical protein
MEAFEACRSTSPQLFSYGANRDRSGREQSRWCRRRGPSPAFPSPQVIASNEDEGFGRAIEDFIPEVMAVLLVCGTSSTVAVADPQAVPQSK